MINNTETTTNRFIPIIFTGLPEEINNAFLSLFEDARNQYLTASNQNEKIAALKNLQEAIQFVDINTPERLLASESVFHAFKANLFQDIKNAYADLGIKTLTDPNKPLSLIAAIITDMSQDKADNLMQLLLHLGAEDLHPVSMKSINDQIVDLYSNDPASEEALLWNQFITTHNITLLSRGNSLNFTVKNTNPFAQRYGQVNILKVDNRRGRSRAAEMHLREEVGYLFTPIEVARRVRAIDVKNDYQSRTLTVTNFYPSGCVNQHALSLLRDAGSKDLYHEATSIMKQMIAGYLDIQDAGCCFPDSKLSNWLVNEQGALHISDTKSLIFAEEGLYTERDVRNDRFTPLRSLGFIPQEMGNPSFDVEKLHAYQLGRNLYTFLTCKWPDKISWGHQHLSGPIWKAYQILIQNLIDEDPKNRIGLEEAYNDLTDLELLLESILIKAKALGSKMNGGIENNLLEHLYGRPSGKINKDASLTMINDSLNELDKALDDYNFAMKAIKEFSGTPTYEQRLLEVKQDIINTNGTYDELTQRLNAKVNDLVNVLEQVTSQQTVQPHSNISSEPVEHKNTIKPVPTKAPIPKWSNFFKQILNNINPNKEKPQNDPIEQPTNRASWFGKRYKISVTPPEAPQNDAPKKNE